MDQADLVRTSLLELPWFETYGLSYDQTMQLPVSEWRRLVTALEAKVAKDRVHTDAASDLNKRLSKMLMDMMHRQAQTT